MKKFIAIASIICLLFCGVAHASNIGLESLWNNVYDSTNQAIKAVVTGNQVLTNITADTATIRVLTVSGDTVLTNTTCDNLTADALYVNENIDWLGGNVTYLQLTDDIETAIAAATAGDTIVLAAGTYTVTDDIDVGVGQSVNIVGQGVGKTTIACATASKNVFDIQSNDVRIADMTITNTGGTGVGVKVSNNSAGAILENLNVNCSGAGSNYGIRYAVAGGTVKNCDVTVSSSDTWCIGIYAFNDSTASADYIVNVYNSTAIATGTATWVWGIASFNNNDANDVTLNAYNCVATASGGTVDDSAFSSQSGTTNNAYLNAYGCTGNGADYDAHQTGTNTLTLYDTTLVNGTTSGTVALSNYNIISSDTVITVGGEVGRISIISSDGNVCYIPVYAAS